MHTDKMKKILSYWYYLAVGAFLLVVLSVYLRRGENVYVAVHDNLDLFEAQYQMLKNTGSWFGHGLAPFLGGISRDVLPSEFSLTSLLYMILPGPAAVISLYFVKVIIAVASFSLLFHELYRGDYDREKYIRLPGETLPHSNPFKGEKESVNLWHRGVKEEYLGKYEDFVVNFQAFFESTDTRAFIAIAGLLYGMLNLFPSFGICFASLPLVPYLAIKLLRAEEKRGMILCLAGFFLYPLLSYFSYFGFFILGYLFLAAIVLFLCRNKKGGVRLLLAVLALALGYMTAEYRLFGMMLFGSTETIRSSFVAGDLTAEQIFAEMSNVFNRGMMHADDAHESIVLPVVLLGVVVSNLRYLQVRRPKSVLYDPLNYIFLLILANCGIYGLYYCGPFRTFVETVLPPLKGFQFNRVIFLNPFLWYTAFCLVLIRFSRVKIGQKENVVYRFMAYCLAVGAALVIFVAPNSYNDLLKNARATVQEENGNEINDLNYREFYSVKLFEEIKEDIAYNPGQGSELAGAQWAVAYGFHPAVLEYNGIATLDGYLGFYPQSYKEAFRKVIAPALDARPATRIYYDEWGARCYLYSDKEDTIVQAVRNYSSVSTDLPADTEALKELGCMYIFSRIELTNAAEKGLTLKGVYTEASCPYTIYLYEM